MGKWLQACVTGEPKKKKKNRLLISLAFVCGYCIFRFLQCLWNTQSLEFQEGMGCWTPMVPLSTVAGWLVYAQLANPLWTTWLYSFFSLILLCAQFPSVITLRVQTIRMPLETLRNLRPGIKPLQVKG